MKCVKKYTIEFINKHYSLTPKRLEGLISKHGIRQTCRTYKLLILLT